LGGCFAARLPGLPLVALWADLLFAGATWARRGAIRAFLVGFGCSLVGAAGAAPVSSVVDVFIYSPLAVITAVTT
jgi:hypothetical protein